MRINIVLTSRRKKKERTERPQVNSGHKFIKHTAAPGQQLKQFVFPLEQQQCGPHMFWPPHRGTTVSQVGSSHQDLAALLNSRVTQSTRLVQISICGRAGPVQAELPPSAAGFITSAQYQNTTGGEEGRCCWGWGGGEGSQAKTACLLSQHHDRSCLRAQISSQRRRKSDKRLHTFCNQCV